MPSSPVLAHRISGWRSPSTEEAAVPDVESVPGGGTPTLQGSLTLGETVVIESRFGPDEVSSGGLVPLLDCAQPEPEPEPREEPEPEPTKEVGVAPLPEGAVATGAGGTAERTGPASAVVTVLLAAGASIAAVA